MNLQAFKNKVNAVANQVGLDIKALKTNKAEKFTIDESLYLDPVTKELRSNLGQMTDVFTFSASKTFVLTNPSVRIIDVFVNRSNKLFLFDDFTVPDEDTIKVDANYPLYANDKIRIKYNFLIS